MRFLRSFLYVALMALAGFLYLLAFVVAIAPATLGMACDFLAFLVRGEEH